jgi:hypothetical protein
MVETTTDMLTADPEYLFSLTMQIGNWKERRSTRSKEGIAFYLYRPCTEAE